MKMCMSLYTEVMWEQIYIYIMNVVYAVLVLSRKSNCISVCVTLYLSLHIA